MFVVGALADPTMENVSQNSSPSLNSKFEKKTQRHFYKFIYAWTFFKFQLDHCAVGTSMRTRHESIGEEGTTKEASSERLHKAGSLISMTSQVINIYSM